MRIITPSAAPPSGRAGALALSQILWIVAVGRLGIGLARMHIDIAPFCVMLLAVAFGGLWDWWQAVGAAVVAAGVVIAQGRG